MYNYNRKIYHQSKLTYNKMSFAKFADLINIEELQFNIYYLVNQNDRIDFKIWL